MNRCLNLKQSTKAETLVRTILIAWRLLLGFALAYALGLVRVESATLSIPCTVSVTIQPHEAAAGTARSDAVHPPGEHQCRRVLAPAE
jgi:hypothetical protein